LKDLGFDISTQVLTDYFNPAKALNMAANTLAGLSNVLTNVFLILLTVIFILFEASGFPKKLYASLGDPENSLPRFGELTTSVNRYVGIKTVFSLVTGITIGIWLAVLGVDYPLLWGMLAFLLNFVPNIGSIIAAVPAVLLALIQLGTGLALMTCLGYGVVNIVVGSILEPKFMGRGLGLSTLVVFLSLVFWGWVLGPIGMVLSVPLTIITKIALDSSEETRWIAVMLGPAPSTHATPKKEQDETNEREA
jgi:predicted PurR-regulated permease PerM